VAEKLQRDRRSAPCWHFAIRLSQLTFTEALLLRIIYVMGLATVFFYEAISIVLKLGDWV
jgi:hypothetical protein